MSKNQVINRRIAEIWSKWGAGLLGIAFTLLFFFLTSRQHLAFDLYAPDVDYFDQAIWNTLHGRFLYSSIIDRSILSYHFSPFLALLSPLFLIWDDVRILFLAQNVAIAATGLILYRLVQREHRLLAPFFLLAFYLNPALHEVALHELRRVIFAMPFLALAVYGLHRRHYRVVALGLGLALLCKEDMALYTVLVGGYLLLFRREWKWGGGFVVAGILWMVGVTFYVIPAINPEDTYSQLVYYSAWGDSPQEIVTTMLRHPLAVARRMLDVEGVQALWRVFLPLGLVLPFFAPDIALLALPSLAMALLSNYPPMHRLEDWYMAPLLPLLFGAIAVALARLPRQRARWYVGALLLSTLAGFLLYSEAPLGGRFDRERYRITPHHRLAAEAVEAVPDDAAIAAQDAFLAHLTHRETIYRYPWIHDPQQVEYYILGRQLHAYPLSMEEMVFEIENLVAEPDITVRLEGDGIFLLEPDGEPLPAFPVERVAEEAIMLEKVDVAVADPASFYEPVADLPTPIRPGQTMRVSLYWRALDTPRGERTVSVRLAGEDGVLLAQQDMQPSHGARPTSWWEPGWYFRDVYYLSLPPEAPAGEATLAVNLYDSYTQEWVPFTPDEAPLSLLPVEIVE
ncbi:MAG TPA: DUF2079 domain-containing protein [Candidatus Sulfomarinibacteraceae bacterium]|nr:DUF2079 domain-containing protein [Candidatus Sulfomarinibacteraceae bacterium]